MADKTGGYLRPTTTTDISCSWGCHRNRKPSSTEPGTDYACAYGSALFAPEDGVIVDVKSTTSGATGRYVTIDMADGWRIRLLHLSRVLVRVGQRVSRGQEIAKSGASGFGKDWGYGAHVHVTLWNRHGYVFGSNATLDFVRFLGADNDGNVAYVHKVALEQSFLNQAQGEKLVVDGLYGVATRDAYKRYQTYLKGRGWYSGVIDGIWGAGTQDGHAKRYAEWSAPHAPTSPQHHTATVDDLGTLPHIGGLQKIAHLYGYTQKGWLDFTWGVGTRDGLQKFLNQNYGGSVANWLRQKYGYVGNDQWGPNMAAAAARAENANWRAL
jgi:murein DD-endopeptidase MepM/ murein hydrolase activator NlpD